MQPHTPPHKLCPQAFECLGGMPIDVAALRRTGIGKLLAKLPKQLQQPGSGAGGRSRGEELLGQDLPRVLNACKALVGQWKRLVEPAAGGSGLAPLPQAPGKASDARGEGARPPPQRGGEKQAANGGGAHASIAGSKR
jgi:hypothetical protein